MSTSVRRRVLACLGATALVLAAAGCSGGAARPSATGHPSPGSGTTTGGAGAAKTRTAPKPYVAPPFRNPLPGMPRVIGNDVYSRTRAGMMSPAVAGAKAYLYVPDSTGNRVTVISQRTHKIVRVLPAGFLSQHVVPAYDLKKLVVNSSAANQMELIDPRTGREGRSIGVPRPYNLYYTPDGKRAIVMVEQHNTIQFSDPHTFRPIREVTPKGCDGPNHADFSGNGRYFVVSCEFSGELVKISTLHPHVLGILKLDGRPTAPHASASGQMGMSMPQDVRLSPDGRTFYVADMGTNELRLIDAKTFTQRRVMGMPSHPHGLYPSRDGKLLYISDRGAGEISVLDFATRKIVATWTIPGGGSPDMGGVSADGTVLWLSGRYDGVVYGFDTTTGKLIAKIPVGGSPHGLAVWPQPGRYSLGHTGNMR